MSLNDFYIKNNKLYCDKPGYCFVFFMTSSCEYCHILKPVFNELASEIKGVIFGYMDIEQLDYRLVRLSEHTQHHIKYVPLLVLFINGELVSQFFPDEENPSTNMYKMEQFLAAFTQNVTQQTTTQQTTNQSEAKNYYFGIPGNRATQNVCYLTVDQAYNSTKK